jgi:hypothetical protein
VLAAILQPEVHLDDLFLAGVNVFNTDAVCSFRFNLMTASEGETTGLILDKVAQI